MGGAAKAVQKFGKKIKKIDPLRGGDVIIEKAGLPTLTGQGDKNILGAFGGGEANSTEGSQLVAPAGAPTTDEARQSAEQASILRRRRGRASTILTSGQGDTSTVNVGTKTLLG